MRRQIKKISKKSGLRPGSIVYVGRERTEKVTIDLIDYDKTELTEKRISKTEECFVFRDTPTITWINMTGIHDIEAVEKLGLHFGIHPLTLEDIANTGHRPKIEETDDYVFLVLKMLYNDETTGNHIAEQVSIIFGRNFVLSFQEKEGEVFNGVRERIRKTIPRVRFLGADYLAYALVDAVVDNYFLVLEAIGEEIESLEDELVEDPAPEDLETLHDLKREMIYIRKAIWPLREVIGGLERLESELIHDFTGIYLRDLYEHTIQVIDTVETYRDMVSGLLDIYLSSISNKMNQVMKVLTIIATIFIPLSFLAGVYGMNFDTSASPFNLPELGFRYGYIGFWIVVMLVGIGLLAFFRRRKWL